MASDDKEYMFRWGLPLNELYSVGLKFYKEKEGSAIQFSYDEKLRLIAFTRQISHGKYNEDVMPPLGVLDVIGRDRRMAWQSLGDMSQRDAMAAFIHLIDKRCLHFNAFVQAHKAAMDEKRNLEETAKREAELLAKKHLEESERATTEDIIKTEVDPVKIRIQEALNAQTFLQFKSYAEQQYPGNPEEQAVLIKQLQDQHYQQYMLQLQQQKPDLVSETKIPKDETHVDPNSLLHQENIPCVNEYEATDSDYSEETSLCPATMWTRKDIAEFKCAIKSGEGDVLKIGHGEILTVRVPTREGCTSIFWEFATDNYDIAFGLFFEWEKSTTDEISFHISDIDEGSDDEDLVGRGDVDVEGRASENNIGPPVSIIIPIYRRDCHLEVYAGTHGPSADGVYLLKFDNSYSMWRSKTIYYRVHYSEQEQEE